MQTGTAEISVARPEAKLEAAALDMLERHREQDWRASEPNLLQAKETQRVTRLQNDAAQIREWLAANQEDRKGSEGAIRKSNRTDNESAKMATSKGVIQGYTGVAAVDAKHQIIVEAQAHGTGRNSQYYTQVIMSKSPAGRHEKKSTPSFHLSCPAFPYICRLNLQGLRGGN